MKYFRLLLIALTSSALAMTACKPKVAADSSVSAEQSDEADLDKDGADKNFFVSEDGSKISAAAVASIAAQSAAQQGDEEVSAQEVSTAAATYVSLKHKGTGKCLDVSGNRKANGTAVILSPCHGKDNQIWQVVGGLRARYKSKSAGRCLEFKGGKGGVLHIFDCKNRANQNIAMQHTNNGLRIQATIGSYDACADVNKNGKLQHHVCHMGRGQMWEEIRR